jgi:hypothetical protein
MNKKKILDDIKEIEKCIESNINEMESLRDENSISLSNNNKNTNNEKIKKLNVKITELGGRKSMLEDSLLNIKENSQ